MYSGRRGHAAGAGGNRRRSGKERHHAGRRRQAAAVLFTADHRRAERLLQGRRPECLDQRFRRRRQVAPVADRRFGRCRDRCVRAYDPDAAEGPGYPGRRRTGPLPRYRAGRPQGLGGQGEVARRLQRPEDRRHGPWFLHGAGGAVRLGQERPCRDGCGIDRCRQRGKRGRRHEAGADRGDLRTWTR